MEKLFENYLETMSAASREAEVTNATGKPQSIGTATERIIELMRKVHARGDRIIFIGNGGSASIASHMAIDYSKNGGLRSIAFNDASALTCLGNDLGYDQVFAHQIKLHARKGDLLIAISSSGRSTNILNAVKAAREVGCAVVTLSGFTPDNPLRTLGDANFYVASKEYGFVEVAHLTICHGILDLSMGWGKTLAR